MQELFRNVMLLLSQGRLRCQRLDGEILSRGELGDFLITSLEELLDVALSSRVTGMYRPRMIDPRPNVSVNYSYFKRNQNSN